MIQFKNDLDLFTYIKEHLYVASVCDILDEMGYRNQAMHQRLRPLLPDMENCGFIGRARTLHWVEIPDPAPGNSYDVEIAAMNALNVGDVVMHSTDLIPINALWGEFMSAVCQLKGVAGCVCDGLIRDCVKIIEMGFPVFYTGIGPRNSKGRKLVLKYDVPLLCGDVSVHPGDLVYADFDGIVVVPKAAETEVFQRAWEKVENENHSRMELLNGKSLREVYDKYKSL